MKKRDKKEAGRRTLFAFKGFDARSFLFSGSKFHAQTHLPRYAASLYIFIGLPALS
jgi:hypothetical protein